MRLAEDLPTSVTKSEADSINQIERLKKRRNRIDIIRPQIWILYHHISVDYHIVWNTHNPEQIMVVRIISQYWMLYI